MRDNTFCSGISLEAGEPLYGTAPQRAHLVAAGSERCLGRAGPWRKAGCRRPYARIAKTIWRRRRRLDCSSFVNMTLTRDLRFFLAVGDAKAPALYRFTLQDHDELLDLDFEALARARVRIAATMSPLSGLHARPAGPVLRPRWRAHVRGPARKGRRAGLALLTYRRPSLFTDHALSAAWNLLRAHATGRR